MTNKSHHFLITCFPLQGHINPTIQLAKNLARGGAHVTFATTICGFARVKTALPTLDRLSYISYSDGQDVDGAAWKTDFVAHMDRFREIGSKELTCIVQKFADEGKPVTCLVYSILLPWVAKVARDMHVPSAFLWSQCATTFAIFRRFFVDSSSDSIEIPNLPLFGSQDLPSFLVPGNQLSSLMQPIMLEHIEEIEKDNETMVLVNTFEELEKEAILALQDTYKIHVVALGPLIPSERSSGMDLFENTEDGYFHWLDTKTEHSVVYISFGSLVVLSKEQKIEIMWGLLATKRPFLWVVRTSEGQEEEDEEVLKLLQNEGGDGMIVPWCLQMEVLRHKAIGCFVTHCGWNSTLESLSCGVPMIGFPRISDQLTNAKMIEEVWRTGVRARIDGDVLVERDVLSKCLDVVIGDGERGKEIRRNAEKWKGLAMEAFKEGGSSDINQRKVLQYQHSLLEF